jgi:hypothetical protein
MALHQRTLAEDGEVAGKRRLWDVKCSSEFRDILRFAREDIVQHEPFGVVQCEACPVMKHFDFFYALRIQTSIPSFSSFIWIAE